MHIAKKTLSFLLTLILIFTFAVFLSAPAKYAESITKGISLWAISVLPATFPLLFLTSLITEQIAFRKCSAKMAPVTKKLFRISGTGGSIALLSVFSGYPVGARSLLNLYETSPYPRDEGFRLSCLASTSGPSFIVGVVGSMMFESAKAGWLMFLSHLIAVFFVCFLLRFTARTQTETTSRVLKQNNGSLFDKIWSSVVSVLCVGGLIAIFSCFSDMLTDIGVFSVASAFGGHAAYAEGVLRGLMEMTTGCAELSAIRTPLSVALSCFLITFGGLCVLLQQLSFLLPTGVKAAPFIFVKFLQAILAGTVCYALVSAFGF